jgi:hypothetical protein
MTRLLLLIAFAFLAAAQSDPVAGTWKPASLSEWRGAPGSDFEARKTHTLVIEPSFKDTYRISVLTADGKPVRPPFVEVYDGKETDGRVPGVRRKMEHVDEYHLRESYTSAKGRIVEDIVVSTNGNNMTISQKGTSTSTGVPVDDVCIYTRVLKK